MASTGLNKWIVSGNLAADVYVRKVRNREESFTVSLNIWERSAAWRKLPYLKKGSLIICTGSIEPNPFISSNGNVPRAGLEMTVLDIDLDIVRDSEPEQHNSGAEVAE